jgi:hypothetical protein
MRSGSTPARCGRPAPVPQRIGAFRPWKDMGSRGPQAAGILRGSSSPRGPPGPWPSLMTGGCRARWQSVPPLVSRGGCAGRGAGRFLLPGLVMRATAPIAGAQGQPQADRHDHGRDVAERPDPGIGAGDAREDHQHPGAEEEGWAGQEPMAPVAGTKVGAATRSPGESADRPAGVPGGRSE